MYRYQKMLLKSDLIKIELAETKNKLENLKDKKNNKKQEETNQEQKLQVGEQVDKDEKVLTVDDLNITGSNKNNETLPETINTVSISDIKNIKLQSKNKINQTKLESPKDLSKDNKVKIKTKPKKKKVNIDVEKKEEANRVVGLPMYTATAVSFEGTPTQKKANKQKQAKNPPKAIIIGLPEICEEELLEELAVLGYNGAQVSKLETKYPKYPPILVQLPIGYDTGEFKKIKRLANCAVEIQIYTGIQCHTCRSFGHASKNCTRPPRCDKCGLEHGMCECEQEESSDTRCGIM